MSAEVPLEMCPVHGQPMPCPQCTAEKAPHSQLAENTGSEFCTNDELFALSPEARVLVIKEMMVSGLDPQDQESLDDSQGINESAAVALAADRALFEVYRDAFLEGKQEKIRQKTAAQIETLKEYFLNQTKSGVGLEKMQKLNEFKNFVDSLVPIVAVKEVTFEEFKSPRALGLKGRGDGFYDTMVQGGAYVYGSFDKFPHNMAFPRWGKVDFATFDTHAWGKAANADELDFNKISPEQARMRHQRRLDEEAIADHAQIVMCDVSEAMPIAHRFNTPAIKFYLDNTFDYRLGKELFKYLFAAVFESPTEAQLFLSQTNDIRAEEWAKPEDDIFSLSRRSYKGISPERVKAIVQDSREICRQFGITLPMQVEVRVRDSAKVQSGW